MLRKNRQKIQLYGLLLYFWCIGVPLYAQEDMPAAQGKDSLSYQIPIKQTPPDALRSFEGMPDQYNTADFQVFGMCWKVLYIKYSSLSMERT